MVILSEIHLKELKKLISQNSLRKYFLNTILTYSYSPQKKYLTEKEFLKLKINWLIKNNKIEVIEKFLNKNVEFDGKSKLIKYLVDFYISSANILKVVKSLSLSIKK